MERDLEAPAAMALSLPNILTYGRILAVPVVTWCLLWGGDGAHWFALALFILAALTDFFDGYLARLWRIQSSLGRMLDPIADKLLVAATLLALVGDRTIYGVHIWAGVIILCREVLVSGLREYLAELRVSVPVTQLAKWKTATAAHRHRISHRRSGRGQDIPVHHVGRTDRTVDRRGAHTLYRLRLFPRRHRPCRGREP